MSNSVSAPDPSATNQQQPADSAPADSFVLISTGLADLAAQNPVRAESVTPHRTYDGKHVRVRHLAFDAGAILAEHTAPRPVVISVVDGEVLFTIGADTHRLRAGAVLHMDQNVPHSVTAVSPARLVLTLVA